MTPARDTRYEKNSRDDGMARLLAQEELILEVTEKICEILESENVTRAELAERLGKSKPYVTQLLNGGRNLTLRTLADVLHVLGYRAKLDAWKDLKDENGFIVPEHQGLACRRGKNPQRSCRS